MPTNMVPVDFDEDFGVLITAAFGLDRSWTSGAACQGYMAGRRTDEHNPWYADWWKMYDGIRGREFVKAALIICHDCPAQYGCARYAVEGRMIAGTWGMTLVDLKWLQAQDDWAEIIDMAEAAEVAMQEVVVALRTAAY